MLLQLPSIDNIFIEFGMPMKVRVVSQIKIWKNHMTNSMILGVSTSRKLATATQPKFPKNIVDFKQATGFQISWRTLRKLMFD
jgi:hypothetical protein